MTNERRPTRDEPKLDEPWYLRYQLVFRAYDQAAVALVLVACVAGMIVYFSYRAHVANGLVDVDRAPPKQVKYLVDINSASWPEIANLPGIGPKLANAIVAHRETHGRFSNHESLIEVSGIGPAKFDGVKEFLAPMDILP